MDKRGGVHAFSSSASSRREGPKREKGGFKLPRLKVSGEGMKWKTDLTGSNESKVGDGRREKEGG